MARVGPCASRVAISVARLEANAPSRARLGRLREPALFLSLEERLVACQRGDLSPELRDCAALLLDGLAKRLDLLARLLASQASTTRARPSAAGGSFPLCGGGRFTASHRSRQGGAFPECLR